MRGCDKTRNRATGWNLKKATCASGRRRKGLIDSMGDWAGRFQQLLGFQTNRKVAKLLIPHSWLLLPPSAFKLWAKFWKISDVKRVVKFWESPANNTSFPRTHSHKSVSLSVDDQWIKWFGISCRFGNQSMRAESQRLYCTTFLALFALLKVASSHKTQTIKNIP